jgi:hypothetical protein
LKGFWQGRRESALLQLVTAIVILAIGAACRAAPATSTPSPTRVLPPSPGTPTPAAKSPATPVAARTSPSVGGTIPLLPQQTAISKLGTPVSASGFEPYLLLNQKFVEGLSTDGGVDVTDVDSVFRYLFGRFPDEVIVYPSENYFYFILNIDGRQFWGNMRLPAGRRENGVLSFAYFEFIDFPSVPGQGLSRAKYYTDADGLIITEIDPLTWDVRFRGKTVRFHLHPLRTDPPESFALGPDEQFVERTFDESGYQFFLMFNKKKNYFFWVLNEEETVPDTFEDLTDDTILGVRSGFGFWVDAAHDNRKILAAIRSISVTRNDYYDGPFDQLADNYVDVNKISEFMARAYPGLAGRIDKYGYHTDTDRGTRVAISAYGSYFTKADVINLIERAKLQEDPIWFLSRGGVPLFEPTVVPPAASVTAERGPTTPTPPPMPTQTPSVPAG